MNRPNAAMTAPVRKLVRFMETRDILHLRRICAANAVLIDSFPPYIFCGKNAPARWATGFITHAAGISRLRAGFGLPREFSKSGDTVFFSQPLTWTGKVKGKNFSETGGLAVVLVRQGKAWRISHYAWAVTAFSS